MRLGILSYPTLFQREGGLQIQIRETMAALLRKVPGIEPVLVDAHHQRLDQFDLIHVFAAINGNHRLLETAQEQGVPTVLSPLIPPGWNRAAGMRARMGDRILGRLTGWNAQSSYAAMRRALQLATKLIALGDAEKCSIREAFLVDTAKVSIVPNGISPRFFAGDPALARARTGLKGPFVLMVAAISPYKNQLGLAHACARLAIPLVLIGASSERDYGYAESLRQVRGTHMLGPLGHDDPLLASAYAAAAVFALPSQGEVYPLSALEALAAGTPVVMTNESALSLPGSQFALRTVPWDDDSALARALLHFLSTPPERAAVQALVQALSWDAAAMRLADCYESALYAV